MPPKGGPPKRGNKIYMNRGGVKAEKVLPMQQKDRAARGGEVGFDENARRDFLNGFHKRKVQRQKEAAKKNEKRARQEKIKERSERRQLLKEARGTAGAADDDGDEEGGDGPQAKKQKVAGAGVQLYGSHIAVSVGGLGGDDEEDEEEEDDE